MRVDLWLFAVLAACDRSGAEHSTPAAPSSAAPTIFASEAGVSVSPEDAAPESPPPLLHGAARAPISVIPVGAATSPVRFICMVRGDCRGTGQLDATAFVQAEAGGLSCEDLTRRGRCENLVDGDSRDEDAALSSLCSLL